MKFKSCKQELSAELVMIREETFTVGYRRYNNNQNNSVLLVYA